ncbi:MAG: hypothetical protein AAB257_02075 [Nitrospinota bacterium]|jgi:hypothetical protein
MFTKKGNVRRNVLILALFTSFLFYGCASGRYIEKPETPPPHLGISSQDNNLNVSIDHVIVTNGPGSWVKDAKWDEYIVTFQNISDKPVSVQSVHLIDPRGLYINPGLDPFQVEKESTSLAKAYADTGIHVVAGAAGVAAGVVGVYFPLIGLPAAMMLGGSSLADARAEKNILLEFQKRQFKPFTFSTNAQLTRSSIFPIIPNPKVLVVDYRVGNEMKTLEVSLEKLAGLHVTPQSKESQPDKEKE